MSQTNDTFHRSEARSFVKLWRDSDVFELIRANKNAFVLMTIIALRARWTTSGFHKLNPGEALIGDFREYNMSEGEYRVAKQHLARWGFATFKTTNKGTVATITNTRIYTVLESDNNGQNYRPTTGQLQANYRPTTTNLEGIEGIERKEGGPPSLSRMADWQLTKDYDRNQRRLQSERNSINPNRELIQKLKQDNEVLNAEIIRRGKRTTTQPQPKKAAAKPADLKPFQPAESLAKKFREQCEIAMGLKS